MNHRRFDLIARHLSATGSRRETANAVAAAGLGLGLARLGFASADAKKNKSKPLKLNAYGCVDFGQACRGNDDNCCSGRCQGKKPKKGKKDTSTCVAHNSGGCDPDQDTCGAVGYSCGGSGAGFCLRTTGRASFCGATGGECSDCKKDVDCQEIYGPGAACVFCAVNCPNTGGTACYVAAA